MEENITVNFNGYRLTVWPPAWHLREVGPGKVLEKGGGAEAGRQGKRGVEQGGGGGVEEGGGGGAGGRGHGGGHGGGGDQVR